MKTSPSLIQLVCSLIFFAPLIHCSRVVLPNNDATLIDQTCKKTQEYQVCVSALTSDPRSATTDVGGLALILVDVVYAKGIDAINKINELLMTTPDDDALKYCAEEYHIMTEVMVPSAHEALPGNPKFGVDALNSCAYEAKKCEIAFSGRPSPLTEKNTYVHDVADAASTIARTLL